MPNYRPKGAETMRKLGRSGGLKSGETRRMNRAARIIEEYACGKWGTEAPETANDGYPSTVRYVWGLTGGRFTLEQIAEALRPVDRRGGSHDTDWRCPDCGHFSSIKYRACASCRRPGLQNGRSTRAALREREKEHGIAAYLAKFGLSAEQR
jgi:hypothetical protein